MKSISALNAEYDRVLLCVGSQEEDYDVAKINSQFISKLEGIIQMDDV